MSSTTRITLIGAVLGFGLSLTGGPEAYAATVNCSGGHCWGSPYADQIRGTGGYDRIEALSGGDEVRARGGPDLIYGGDGPDTLYGGAGNERYTNHNNKWVGIQGEAGRDLIKGKRGADVIRGGGGRDRLHGNRGHNDVLIAWNDGFTTDRVWGGGGNNDTCYLSVNIDIHGGGCENIYVNHWA